MNMNSTAATSLASAATAKRAAVRHVAAELRQMRQTPRTERTSEWKNAFTAKRRELRTLWTQYLDLLPAEPSVPGYEESFDMWVVIDDLENERQQHEVLKQRMAELVQPHLAQAAKPQRILKQSALIAELEHVWPTIAQDLKEASRNGLTRDAKMENGWDVNAARAWADHKGKLKSQTPLTALSASTWPGEVTRHTIT